LLPNDTTVFLTTLNYYGLIVFLSESTGSLDDLFYPYGK
jgi:hypothetical protein